MVGYDNKKFIKWLSENWEDNECPVCKGENWSVSDVIFEMREFSGGGLSIGGSSQILPIIPVICANCGYIAHFSGAKYIKENGKKNKK